jgi:1-acyl-sn-glycerol-3-phosphate acyltransferase
MVFKIYSKIAYLITKWVFRIILKIFFRFRVKGQDNIPDRGSFILASNHLSYMDPAILGVASRKRLYFITSDHLYENMPASLWYKSVGCIRIKRGEADHRAMRKILNYLKNGKAIAIFPEGTRSDDGKMKDAFAGIGFLAFKSQVPVVPCLIRGSNEALPRSSKSLKSANVTASIGGPLTVDDFSFEGGKKEAYHLFSRKVMESIATLDKSE